MSKLVFGAVCLMGSLPRFPRPRSRLRRGTLPPHTLWRLDLGASILRLPPDKISGCAYAAEQCMAKMSSIWLCFGVGWLLIY